MSSTCPVYIRVTVNEDGKTLKREVMHEGQLVCEISPTEIIEMVMQASSSLRYDVPKVRG